MGKKVILIEVTVTIQELIQHMNETPDEFIIVVEDLGGSGDG